MTELRTVAPAVVVSSHTDIAVHAVPPQIVAHELAHGSIAACAVTYRGSGHASLGEPRQDSFALGVNESWMFAVVSDGIGSCEHSEHGSAAAANAVATALAFSKVDPVDGQAVLAIASAACIEAASLLGVDPNQLAATFTVAAIEAAAQPGGAHHVLLHSAGDSPALLLRPATDGWTYLTPRHDLPSNVVEDWVPNQYGNAMHAGCELAPGEVLILCSDGFSIPLGEGDGPLGVELASRWAAGPRNLVAFVVDLASNAYHDDKTVVAVWNCHQPLPA